jgi:archaetidylinositol phosphate synthase
MTPVNRIQENLLAKSERRLLNWLCARLPAWVKPDQLTAIGFSGACLSSAGYVLSNFNAHWLWLAIAGYFINWFGDSLDGSLARFRKIERPNYGYFIDHSADSLANMILVCGIGFSPYVELNVAMFGLVGYLLMSIHTFLAARVMGEFRLSYMAGGPTELRIVLILVTLGMLLVGPGVMVFKEYTAFDLIIGLAAGILVSLYIVQTITSAKILLNPPSP